LDLSLIANALQGRAFRLASTKRTVSITGDANNAVVIAGDRNVLFILSGPAADTLRQTVLSDPIQIQKACRKVSERLASELLGDSIVISRRELEEELDRFIESPDRWFFINGDSGVGKSVFAGSEVKRLSDQGWAVLLMRGATFSLEYMARLIVEDGLGQPVTSGARYLIRQPWLADLPKGIRGLLVIIDDLVPENSTNELLKLIDALSDLPGQKVKVVVTCNTLAWERLHQDYHLPFHKDTLIFGDAASSEPPTPQLGYFSQPELTQALQAIGDTELIPTREGEWPDSHIESVRALLTHPATFGHYAHLRRSGNDRELGELTWSKLIAQRLNQALALAAKECGLQPDALREYLLEFARIAVERKAPDFRLAVDLIRERIPQLEVDRQLPSASPLVALQQAGVLMTATGPTAEKLIGFSVSDMGGYISSFVFEREANDKSTDELRALINSWVQEAWSYHPQIDGLLAWLDRLTEDPDDPKLLLLLEALIETHLFKTASLFRLVRPSLISAIFDFIKQKDSGPVFKYREAAYALRSSPEALREIREHLHDADAQSQRVAVKLVGQHKDTASIPALIDLLGEPERKRDLHAAIYVSLSSIGEMAITDLLNVVTDLTSPVLLRSRCLIAVRNIGTLTGEVSAAIAFCFEHRQEGDDELLRSALFTAAHLRDCSQHGAAISGLHSPDWQSVIAAIKIVMECGSTEDVPHLYRTLGRWNRPESDPLDRTWVIRQLLSALIKLEGGNSYRTVLDLLRHGLAGNGLLRPVEAVWAGDEIDCPGSKAAILEDVLKRLATKPPDGLIWQSFNRLGQLWRPDHLDEVHRATNSLDSQTSVAERVVGAIEDGVKAEKEHPLLDHHAQVAAFKALAKWRAPDFGVQASRLLADAEWTFDLTICDTLWVVGDERAAPALLKKADQHTSGGQGEWLQRSHAMRALSTCGSKEFVAPLVSYITTETEISIYLPSDTILPLVLRGLITVDGLRQIIRDPKLTTYGRVACLQTLGLLEAEEHADFFSEIASNQDNEILQSHAIQALGDLRFAAAATKLRRLLRDTQSVSLARTIARALAQMRSEEAIPDIVKCRSRFAGDATGFNIELARLGERSALRPLLEAFSGERLLTRGALNAIGLFLPDAHARTAILERLENFQSPQMDTGEQHAAIKVLARRNPGLLIDRVQELYRFRRLHKSARQGLASLMPDLISTNAAQRPALLELMKQLISDPSFEIRRDAMEVLFRIDNEICAQIYDDLKGEDEWSRACAVNSLGYWDSPDHWINEARRDSELLVRRAADEALAAKDLSTNLQGLMELYQSGTSLDRLAAYLALEENGDYPTMWRLCDTTDKSSLAHVFLRELWEGIKKHSQTRQQKAEKEEQDFLASRGTVKFA
jgi:HEAT repeat protein